MLSQKQLLANRQNALLSTGPRTSEGKAIASQNAVKHGLRSDSTVIPGETPEEFDQFRRLLLDDLSPVGAMEVFLADRIVAGFWKLRRAGRIETEMIRALHHAFIRDKQLRQQKIHDGLQAELQKKRQQELMDLHDPKDYQTVRDAWAASEQARMIRENRWPRTPGHPAPDEAMKKFIADETLKLRKQRQQAMMKNTGQTPVSDAQSLPSVPKPDFEDPQVIGHIMQDDITGSNVLSRFRRYECQIERSLYKALTELQKIQLLRSQICFSTQEGTRELPGKSQNQ
ncbi:MAG: hypothetical protein ACYSO4_09275 [Planctomycetota bacterium]|jgi:hypothetical protein